MMSAMRAVAGTDAATGIAWDGSHGHAIASFARLRALRCGSFGYGPIPAPAPSPRPIFSGSILDVPLELQHPIKTGELKIITQDFTEQTSPPTGMTEEDQEKLLRDHVLITDKRDSQKTTIPYDVQTEKAFFNPTATGLYEILTRAGNFERCLVLLRPQGPRVRADFATVIRLGEPRNWRNSAPAACGPSMLAMPKARKILPPGSRRCLRPRTWPSARAAATSSSGPTATPRCRSGSTKSLGDQNGSDVYEVSFDTYCPGPYSLPAAYPSYDKKPYSDVFGYDAEYGQRIHLNGKDGQQLFNNRGDVYVPKGFRVLAVEPDETDKDQTAIPVNAASARPAKATTRRSCRGTSRTSS